MTGKKVSEAKDVAGAPSLEVAPAPHVHEPRRTTAAMMRDVLIALAPIVLMAAFVFGPRTWLQVAVGVASAMVAETVCAKCRGRPLPLSDGSAAVTGLILALSLPVTAPWYVGCVGAVAGIGLGKAVFGGLGQNIFNPAMVGRAFAMMAFPSAMGAAGYVDPNASVQAITQATPLTALKQAGLATPLGRLLVGNTNGSLGETSAILCALGGLYLCARRTASWEIPGGILASASVLAALIHWARPGGEWGVAHELAGGALLFGAFFIATDPVTSPVTRVGKWIFGAAIGALVILIRKLSGYPEGVMFSVLIMNGFTPLLNRWTIPVPVGGPVSKKEEN